MHELEFSTELQRRLRRSPLDELGKRTEDWLIELIKAGEYEQAIEVAGYLLEETQMLAEHGIEVQCAHYAWIAEHLGEETLHEILKDIRLIDKLQQQHGALRHLTERTLTPAEFVRVHEGEHKRCHRNIFTIEEEPERFKITFLQCTPGRIRRLRDEHGQPPPCAAKTERPHPWTWGRVGIPLFCTRIATTEIRRIEERGYPHMITECAEDDFSPCYRYVYKDPAAIPDRYYERVGKQRPELPSRPDS